MKEIRELVAGKVIVGTFDECHKVQSYMAEHPDNSSVLEIRHSPRCHQLMMPVWGCTCDATYHVWVDAVEG